MSSKFDALIGQVIDKRYKIISAIGEGGMAVVFKARDLTSDRVVAIKVLNEDGSADGHAVKRFLNESKAISMLSHENIVKIYDVSVSRELKYIVMEHIDGETLKGYMDRKGKRLSFEEALGFAEQILSALEHAHTKKVIHRDIKPHNIMVLKNGFVKVTDFGIAKTPSGDTISVTDKALGTVYYISPEQASGKETGIGSDIYSVGVMLYEMATGKLPFYADSPVTVAMMQINDTPELPSKINPDIPRGLEQIILKAMNKNPDDRFKSAHSMLRAVKILKDNPAVVFEEIKKTPGGSAHTNKKPPHRRGGLVGKFHNFIDKITPKPDPKAEKEPARVTFFPIILGITCSFFAVLLVSGFIAAGNLLSNLNKTDVKMLEVPNLIGEEYTEELLDSLEKQSFDVEIKWAEQRNDTYGYGEIYSTVPAPNSVKKAQGSLGRVNLVLYVNPREGSEVFPDYSVQNLNSVKTSLNNKGYKNLEIVEESHDTVLENHVIRTYPEPGDMVKPTDTIVLYVSTGKKLKNVISMPDLVGKSKGEAAVELQNFEVECIEVDDVSDEGTVIWQSVDKYTVISPEFCEKITLYVSNGSLSETTSPLYLIMPDLTDKTLAEAEELMRDIASYGIKIMYEAKENTLPAGVVFYQSIEPDSMVLINYSKPISIYYSDGSAASEETADAETDIAENNTDTTN